MLVVLRLGIGWHFFTEGVSHYAQRGWSSEGFLRQAKGPLADMYSAYLPDFHGFTNLITAKVKLPPAPAKDLNDPKNLPALIKPFYEKLEKDWEADRKRFADHYKLDKAQTDQTVALKNDNLKKVDDFLHEKAEDIVVYRYELERNRGMSADPQIVEVPFQKTRFEKRDKETSAKPAAWLAELKAYEQNLQNDLNSTLTDAQKKLPAFEMPPSPLERVDTIVMYGLIIIGACLVLGLFTRLAAVLGAAFLISVVVTQLPWVPNTLSNLFYYQSVEIIALLTLATTAVGRWGGLDFFIHNFVVAPRCRAKGKTV